MKDAFFELADTLVGAAHADETLLLYLSAERSDFVRFNHARVRQAGTVEQRYLSVRLVHANRQASAGIALAGGNDDAGTARETIARLRTTLAQLPEDPWLDFNRDPQSTSSERRGRMPVPEDLAAHVAQAADGADFVGFYAGGTVYRGFANSLGQRNWHEADTFNFDWSLHLAGDKAVKTGYAGFEWEPLVFDAKLGACVRELDVMRRPPRTLAPAEYRTYLTPRALEEVTGLLSWSAFSARARATRQTPLLRMEHGERLSPKVTLAENAAAGLAPVFQEEGYVKPSSVTLIAGGTLGESLVSARSARQYGLQPNGAGGRESPETLEMEAGTLAEAQVLPALDTGLYVSNLWYLNFSDRPAGRMTGMTRFATFWVEGGRIVAPVTPLRFDDTLYRMLGENLTELTRSRELLLSTSTYDERSTASAHLPGALLAALRFTL